MGTPKRTEGSAPEQAPPVTCGVSMEGGHGLSVLCSLVGPQVKSCRSP